jgi:hypothetical protein
LILEQNQLGQDPMTTMQRIYEFLSIPDHSDLFPKRVNEAWYQPIMPTTEQRLRTWFAEHKRQLQALLDELGQSRAIS